MTNMITFNNNQLELFMNKDTNMTKILNQIFSQDKRW